MVLIVEVFIGEMWYNILMDGVFVGNLVLLVGIDNLIVKLVMVVVLKFDDDEDVYIFKFIMYFIEFVLKVVVELINFLEFFKMFDGLWKI